MRGKAQPWILLTTAALTGAIAFTLARAQNDASSTAARSKPPTTEQLKKATDDVRSAFKSLYATKTIAGRKALTKKLLEEAETLGNDSISRYAMLQEARDVAIEAGDVETALNALAGIEKHFDADQFNLRREFIEGVAKQIARLTPVAAAAFAEAAVGLVDDAIAKENVSLASRLLVHADTALLRVNDKAQAAIVRIQMNERRDLLTFFEKVDAMRTKLLQNPNDSDAMALVGRYDCFVKKSFEKGLLLLDKSSDTLTRPAVAIELKTGRVLADSIAAGDAWLTAAKAEKVVAIRVSMAQRAIHWYDQSLKELTGAARTHVERACAEAYKAARMPAGYGKLTNQEREAVVRLGNKWFLLVNSESKWEHASTWCAQRFGRLASIENSAENRVVNKLVNGAFTEPRTVWLGGKRVGKQRVWRWQDGNPFKYSNWHKEEFDGSTDERCLILWPDGTFVSSTPSLAYPFVAMWTVD